ncbi:MAG: hypothetical protein PVG60_10080 [Desulfarculaceae bacterium]
MPQSIVSFHPLLLADDNRLLISQRPLYRADCLAVARSAAVILPQVCRPDLFQLVAGLGRPHFPRAAIHLSLDGKVGNHLLFKRLGLPHPPTGSYETLEEAVEAWRGGQALAAGLRPPLVVKGAGGGEGKNVFLVHNPGDLAALKGHLTTLCQNGPSGLVLQPYVDCGGWDARAIFIGDWEDAFWRVGRPGDFRSNLSQGGRVERSARQEDLKAALDLARRLRRKAGLDLAAVDLLVPRGGSPLLLEVNFYFGRQALGGSRPFLSRYLEAVQGWLAKLGLDPQRVKLDQEAL